MGYSPRPSGYRRRWWHPVAQVLYAAGPVLVVVAFLYVVAVWYAS